MVASLKINRGILVTSTIAAGVTFCIAGSMSNVRAQVSAEPRVLGGRVIYRERMALPSTAVVEVKLVDVSRADAAAVTIAERRIEGATGSPIPFELQFDNSQIQSNRSYALQARISIGGQLLFLNTSRHVVFDGGPDNTDILVEKVGGKTQERETPIGKWLAEDIEGGGVIDRLQSVLEIGPDRAVSGTGGCNRFTGRAKIDGSSITFGPIAATDMACTPAVMDQERKFHAALAITRYFEVQALERKLLLFDADGNAILRLAEQ